MADERSLNKEQLQAVMFGEGSLLIIAGAGTGKTTVITKRIEHLIAKKNISPGHILALTFTEKAATEMESRIDEILPYGYTNMWIETFHAFCDRILRAEAIHIGLNPSFKLLSEADSLLYLRKNLHQFELDYFRPLGNPMKFLQGMLQHFSRLKDDDITPEQYMDYAKSQRHSGKHSASRISYRSNESDSGQARMTKNNVEADDVEAKKIMELAKAYKLYEDLKAKDGFMDYSDLITNTLKLFRMRKNVLKRYQELFQYVFVDEFQDTNYAQNELAILLAGNRQNITVVGDDDQSIYRWRGAAISNMMQFKSHFPKATIITLTKNYRSTQNILDSAYKLIQYNNPDRLEVKERINKQLEAMREVKGDEVEFVFTNRGEDEAEAVAKKIKEEIKKTKRPYNEFSILVRANDHATPFQRALDRAHIPYQFLGPGKLFQQDEIKDMIAYLRVLADFEDTASLYRILTIPIFVLEARDIAALLNFSKKTNSSLFEAMEQVDGVAVTKNGKERIATILAMIKGHLKKISTETAGQILYYFFEESGLLGHYLDPRSPRTEKEAQNVAKFFEKLQSFEANREDASVFAVIDWIDISMELGESPMAAEIDWTRNNAVNILTVHSSKGLEFPVVFVVNLVTQRFPGRDRKEQIPIPPDLIREALPEGDENLQEERRLFYVAITRAKEKLYLTAARFYGDGKRERKVSPFVIETLGENVVNFIMKKQAVPEEVQQLTLLDMFNTNIAAQEEKKKTPPTQTAQISPLTYVSYSQLQTFQTCPLHYKLKYILNVPTPPSQALSYGVSVHSTLRDFFQALQSGENPTTEHLYRFLQKNWIPFGYMHKNDEKRAYEQAQKVLANIAQKTHVEKPETIAIELPFNFWLNKQLKVGGRIDRIDKLKDDTIEIIDYKTGSNVPTGKKIKDDLQLSFYALAATEIRDQILNRTPDQIKLTLYYVEADKKISTTRTKDELELAKQEILSLVERIERSEFKCTGGMFCKNCEYKMLCASHTS